MKVPVMLHFFPLYGSLVIYASMGFDLGSLKGSWECYVFLLLIGYHGEKVTRLLLDVSCHQKDERSFSSKSQIKRRRIKCHKAIFCSVI